MSRRSSSVKKHEANIGKKFGRLTVLGFERDGDYYRYICRCDCGTHCAPHTFSVLKGTVASCGCLQREWARKSHPPYNRKLAGESGLNYMFLTYRRNAKMRGYEFALTKEQFRVLTQQNCVFCGAFPNRFVKYWRPKASTSVPYCCNGVDRLDNIKGYTVENSVPCCTHCNVAKGTKSKLEFLNWIQRLHRFQFGPSVIFYPRPVYVDVDGTLIFWNLPDNYTGPTIEIDEYNAYNSMRVCRRFAVNQVMIDCVRQHKAEGCQIVVWSAGGAPWALAVVKALALLDMVDLILDKPIVIYDDWKPAVWMPEPRCVLDEGWVQKIGGIVYRSQSSNGDDDDPDSK